MEKDFKKEKEMLKEQVKNEVNDELGKQIEYCQNKIEKLTDIREQMENLVEDKDNTIKELNKKILILEDE
jgi:prefoldin subunit 5